MTKLATLLHLARSISTYQAPDSEPPTKATLVCFAPHPSQINEFQQALKQYLKIDTSKYFTLKTLKNSPFVSETIRFLRSLVGYFEAKILL